ncbi:3-(methylthio)propionyl-CoA ligase [Pseudoduganella ginsengisoli]|uniref:Long-chain-fatty-acid--CoA ligase n=1 Tax=Pseudoduganella ginsengisoli TaxID=1462440 RepID=A0A6L6Q6Y7_9BURK|nr:3-(methylthio)propionyl-CoA ligase [Pseudoduganella ginsengisoli]MTW05008.1 long-chain-fatty-acid--CoA ligase [Pseudoduganella ginsengisoli]
MLGLMQDQPLVVSHVLQHAERNHPEGEIISRTVEGTVHRTTYGGMARRARRLANALTALHIRQGDRIGTLAWNTCRHMELYFGVSGMGAVLHTINPRLFPEQVEYIVKHAQDEYLFFDMTFAPLIAKVAPLLPNVKGFIAMTDRLTIMSINDLHIPRLLCYEDLLEGASEDFQWPELDERSACSLCYTSGTTGNPKGVLYSHRSTVLHSMAMCSADGAALASNDTVIVVVPMFHVNAWGLPYAGAMCGAKLVLPGPALDGASVYGMLKNESVTLALGVPTVWLMLFQHVDELGLDPRAELQLRRVAIGGSAVPRAMVETFMDKFGAAVLHVWGMTEMSPLGTLCRLLPKHDLLDAESQMQVLLKQGRAPFGVELRITDADGKVLPRDGKSSGHLKVKGPWILKHYFGAEHEQLLDGDGYFDTGDIANIDADGYLQITDRAKDVIKSGGEWISSIDLENAAMGHAAVAEAAVIGVPHEKWQERPLLIVVCKAGTSLSRAAMLAYLDGKVAKWWMPDDVVFVDELPHTATGKVQKLKLREQFRQYRLPQTEAA